MKKPLASYWQCLTSLEQLRNNLEISGADSSVFNALNLLESECLKHKLSETIIQKKITDHFAQIPFKTEADKIMDLCNSLESSGLSESSGINLHNQKMCISCDENLVGAYKCQECDILCQKCYKAHSRLKITKIHVVTSL